MFKPITPEVLESVRSSEKAHRMIMSPRDSSFRSVRRSVADGLAAINDAAFTPVGPIRGIASNKVWLSGQNVSLILMVGETEAETFSVGFPFATTFRATSLQDGKRRSYWASQFDGSFIETDGNVRLYNRALAQAPDGGNLVEHLEFDDVGLQFELTEVQLAIRDLAVRYFNESGIAQQRLGREMSAGNFPDLLAVKLKRLEPLQGYIVEHWPTLASASPPPSRETIATTFEALCIRPRSRGKRALRQPPARAILERQLSTQLRLRTSRV